MQIQGWLPVKRLKVLLEGLLWEKKADHPKLDQRENLNLYLGDEVNHEEV